MNLLNENEEQKKQKTKGQKTVLSLLIISIILLVIVVVLMVVIQPNEKNSKMSLIIDGQAMIISNNNIIESSSGKKYISLSYLCNTLKYTFENSDYQTYELNTGKCYLEKDKNVYSFELNSTTMYKYFEESNLDYQYFSLNNAILSYQNEVYIAVEDLPVALNIKCTINKNNSIVIETAEYLAQVYQTKLTGYTITTDKNCLQALSYSWIVASKNGLWGVIDESGNTILSFRYNTIEFNESDLNYIVSKDGTYGIISTSGKTTQALIYDDIQVLNFKNKLYKVKANGKFGIINKDGDLVGEIVYDDIGFPENQGAKILYTLIVPQISDSEIHIPETIVVKKGNKYGLLSVESGAEIIPCDHLNKLYAQNELGNISYKIEAEGITLDLIEYLKLRQIGY